MALELNAVVVGLGKQSGKHASALVNQGHSVICGVDPEPEARDKFSKFFKVASYSSIDDIKSDAPGNIAIICTPVGTRLDLIHTLITKGVKTFLVEKPLAITLEECLSYIEIEHRFNVKIYVNYTYRVSSPYYQINHLHLIDDLNIDYGMFYLGGTGSHQAWKHQIATGGGAFNEMGVHMLDLTRFLFGDIIEFEIKQKILVRPKRIINDINVDVDAEDLIVGTVDHGKAKTLIIADFLSPKFTNRVHLTNTREQFECTIGSFLEGYESEFSEIDIFGSDAYARIYHLISNGLTEGLHRPTDTHALLNCATSYE